MSFLRSLWQTQKSYQRPPLKQLARSTLGLLGIEVEKIHRGLQIRKIKPSSDPLFDPKIDLPSIERAIGDVREKWPECQIAVLVDDCLANGNPSVPRIHCGKDGIEKIQALPFDRTIFVYACDSDVIGLPYLQEIIKQKGRFYPVQIYRPSLYINVNDRARNLLESEFVRQRNAGFDKFERYALGDFQNIIQAIEGTARLKGDYLEIGCFMGSSSCVAVRYMKEMGLTRNCYFLDVFEGFNYSAAKESADTAWAGTHMSHGVEVVRKRISECGNPPALNVFVIKNNIVEDQLPSEIGDVVVANIDVDLYEAVHSALFKVAPKIIDGGIIIVEDPGHTPSLIGSRLALQEFLESPEARPFLPLYMESGQTLLVKLFQP
jgi:hypothetical protein